VVDPLATGMAAVGAYLLGSVPAGLLVARAVADVDIRGHGSGNIGATNVGRVIGRRWGALVWALDVLKGFLPVLVVCRLTDPPYPWGGGEGLALPLPAALCGLAAVCGHNFSVFLRFRGGKGVSTTCGVLLYVFPWGLAAGAGVWVLLVAATRYVSAGSMCGALAVFAAALVVSPEPFGASVWLTALSAALAVLVVIRHQGNIRRLLAGAEHKVGGRRTEGERPIQPP